MLFFLIKNLITNWKSVTLLIVTLILMGVGIISSVDQIERTSIKVEDELGQNWRTGFDLLVLPQGTGSEEMELLRPNFIDGIYGGITLEQYEKIKEIEGVEVAAPIAYIGYFNQLGLSVNVNNAPNGFYIQETETRAWNGLEYRDIDIPSKAFPIIPVEKDTLPSGQEGFDLYREFRTNYDWRLSSELSYILRQEDEWFIVGIDPEQEYKLINLNESITSGKALEGQGVRRTDIGATIPIILLQSSIYDSISETNLYKIDVPENLSRDDIKERGGSEYLKKLPRNLFSSFRINPYAPEYLHRRGTLQLVDDDFIDNTSPLGDHLSISTMHMKRELSSIEYSLVNQDNIPYYRAIPTFSIGEEPQYRTVVRNNEDHRNYGFDIIGYYDASKLVSNYSTHPEKNHAEFYMPLDIYFIRDKDGNEVNVPFVPSPRKTSYFTGPPDAITTLQGASFLTGSDQPISAIRIIVEGAGTRSKETEYKVEDIAEKIRELTGLEVNVTLGSDRYKVHVELPGVERALAIGTVEEGWLKRGATWALEQSVAYNQYLFIGYLIIVASILTICIQTNRMISINKILNMLRVLGWKNKKLIFVILMETIIIVSLVVLFTIVYSVLSFSNELFYTNLRKILFIQLPITFLLILIPAQFSYLKMSRLTIIDSFKGEYSREKKTNIIPLTNFFTLVLKQTLRRPIRLFIKWFSIYISAVMFILLVAVKYSFDEYLFASFLGEDIQLIIGPTQWILFIIGLGITLISIVVVNILNVIDRQKDLSIFSAVGWSKKKIVYLMTIEESIVLGSSLIIGALTSLSLLIAFGTFSLSYTIITLSLVMSFTILLTFSLTVLFHILKKEAALKTF